MTVEQLQIKSLNTCTLEEITELWNVGFQQYYNDMTRQVDQIVNHLGACSIKPQLSVAAYMDRIPAGFVFVGVRDIRGVKTAWNGGTGVNPLFRGRGIASMLLQEAIKRMQEAEVDIVTLEVRSDNTKAITAYQKAGFQSIHRLPVLIHSGIFGHIPFRRSKYNYYRSMYGNPEAVSRLPFYMDKTAWMTQWFNMPLGCESLIVYDSNGEAVGYALFSKSFTSSGELVGITLYHCEANTTGEEGSNIVRDMLAKVYAPLDAPVLRTAHYMRSTNLTTMEALLEAGFQLEYEEQLMMMQL